jgi:RNA recognition motif-containing protein
MGKKMFVGGLPLEVNEAKLRELFAPYGSVVGAKVIIDRETGRSKGFGFVEMATDDEAKAATDKLNNSVVGERKIFVNEARPMEARPRPAFGEKPGGRPSFGDKPSFGPPSYGDSAKGGYGDKKRSFGPDKKSGGRKGGYGDKKGGYGDKKGGFGDKKGGFGGKKGRRDPGDDGGW